MTILQTLAALLAASLLALSSLAIAQNPGESRGSTPPGTSNDGAKPSDGAITGGSILPGERSGIPGSEGTKRPSVSGEKRCMELSGSLREQCLLQERGSSTGGTRAPDLPVGRDPRTDAPPQNPR